MHLNIIASYVREQYINGSHSLNRISDINRRTSKNDIIIYMARLRYSHLHIPTVISTAKSVIASLELLKSK